MSAVATATLVVGLLLLVAALLAWAVVRELPPGDGRRTLALTHLPALADWALIALGVHAVALLTGGGSLMGWTASVVGAVAAAITRWLPLPEDHARAPAVAAPDPAPAHVPDTAPLWDELAVPEPAHRATLWAEPEPR